mgnify:CR=1 FL=1
MPRRAFGAKRVPTPLANTLFNLMTERKIEKITSKDIELIKDVYWNYDTESYFSIDDTHKFSTIRQSAEKDERFLVTRDDSKRTAIYLNR